MTAPFGGVTCFQLGALVVVQVLNISLSAGATRKLGTLKPKPQKAAVGCINVGTVSGYVKVDTDGVVTAYAGSNGDYSGQVVFAA